MLIRCKYFRGSIRLATLGFVLCFTLAQISSAQGATHFTTNGPAASWGLGTDDGVTSFGGSVFANGAIGQDAQTFMVLSFYTQTPTTQIQIYGFGTIPNQAFQGNSTGHMALNVDLSQATGFTSCTTDYANNNTVTCSDSPTGAISVEWKKPAFATVQADYLFNRARLDIGGMTIFLMGQYNNTNAITTGTAFGIALPSGYGVMGTSRQMGVTIQRNP